MLKRKRGGNKMLDVSMMTIEQFERLLNKPKLTCGVFTVEKAGVKIVLGNWVNKYCLGILLGSSYEDYLDWFLDSVEPKAIRDVEIDKEIRKSLRTYISDKLGQEVNEVEYNKVLEVLLSIKGSLLQLLVLRKNVELPIFEVFHTIRNINNGVLKTL